MFIMLSWLFSVSQIIKSIVVEKETRLTEVMKVSLFITPFIKFIVKQ